MSNVLRSSEIYCFLQYSSREEDAVNNVGSDLNEEFIEDNDFSDNSEIEDGNEYIMEAYDDDLF